MVKVNSLIFLNINYLVNSHDFQHSLHIISYLSTYILTVRSSCSIGRVAGQQIVVSGQLIGQTAEVRGVNSGLAHHLLGCHGNVLGQADHVGLVLHKGHAFPQHHLLISL